MCFHSSRCNVWTVESVLGRGSTSASHFCSPVVSSCGLCVTVSALHCENCSMINRHNRIRQDDLCIEQKFVTREWHCRVNMMLFGMCVVDAHLLHKECTGCDEPPNTFFWKLAAEIIDQTTTRSRQVPSQLTETNASRPQASTRR